MAIYVLPQKKTFASELGGGLGQGLSGGLQLAFQQYLKNKMDEQQRQRNIEQAQQMFPGAFTEVPQTSSKIPKKYQFNLERAKEYPGMEINPITGEFGYKVPTSLGVTPIFNITSEGEMKQVGTAPKGAKILTPSQMETPEQKMERTIETGKQSKAQEAKMEVQAIEGMVDSVWNKANELIPATEGVQSAAFQGLRKDIGTTKAGRLLGASDENAITFREFKEGTLSMLIRSLGEKGMLTDQDIKRARDFEPSNWDTPKIREQKEIAMKEFLKSKISAYYQNIGQGEQIQQTQPNQIGRFTVEVE